MFLKFSLIYWISLIRGDSEFLAVQSVLYHNDLCRLETKDEVACGKTEYNAHDHTDVVSHDCQHAHIGEPYPQDEDDALTAAPSPQLL